MPTSTPWELYEAEMPSPDSVRSTFILILLGVVVIGIVLAPLVGAI